MKETEESGLKVVTTSNRGRGVITTMLRKKGDYICRYIGDLITATDGKRREEEYSKDPMAGCFMFYFKYQDKCYW